MGITNVGIKNYKSLRNLNFTPENLTVLVGANASGKSNLADCFDFLSEVYRHGLETAVARKGGYENIAHRKVRRSKSPISIELTVTYSAEFLQPLLRNRKAYKNLMLKARHAFSFQATGTAIRAAFKVTTEQLDLEISQAGAWMKLISIDRQSDRIKVEQDNKAIELIFGDDEMSARRMLFDLDYLVRPEAEQIISRTELLISNFRFAFALRPLVDVLGNIRVYQINPTVSREFGAPQPRAELKRDGQDLPSVIDLLQKKQRDNWEQILQAMRRILPDLEEIEVSYTTDRSLSLFFRERNMGRPWNIGEVSDGTVQTLALLVAIFDPNSTLLIIEEPENSVHPWIIRHLVDACREAAKTKQVIITTHSPIVINSVEPDRVWIVWRSEGESHLAPLTVLDETYRQLWETGTVATFEFLDSGELLVAIPPVPNNIDVETRP